MKTGFQGLRDILTRQLARLSLRISNPFHDLIVERRKKIENHRNDLTDFVLDELEARSKKLSNNFKDATGFSRTESREIIKNALSDKDIKESFIEQATWKQKVQLSDILVSNFFGDKKEAIPSSSKRESMIKAWIKELISQATDYIENFQDSSIEANLSKKTVRHSNKDTLPMKKMPLVKNITFRQLDGSLKVLEKKAKKAISLKDSRAQAREVVNEIESLLNSNLHQIWTVGGFKKHQANTEDLSQIPYLRMYINYLERVDKILKNHQVRAPQTTSFISNHLLEPKPAKTLLKTLEDKQKFMLDKKGYKKLPNGLTVRQDQALKWISEVYKLGEESITADNKKLVQGFINESLGNMNLYKVLQSLQSQKPQGIDNEVINDLSDLILKTRNIQATAQHLDKLSKSHNIFINGMLDNPNYRIDEQEFDIVKQLGEADTVFTKFRKNGLLDVIDSDELRKISKAAAQAQKINKYNNIEIDFDKCINNKMKPVDREREIGRMKDTYQAQKDYYEEQGITLGNTSKALHKTLKIMRGKGNILPKELEKILDNPKSSPEQIFHKLQQQGFLQVKNTAKDAILKKPHSFFSMPHLPFVGRNKDQGNARS